MEKAENIISLLKIMFLGNTQVGKTQLINRLRDDKFLNFVTSTSGFDFCSIKIQNTYLQVWDSPSTGKQTSQVGSYITGSNIVCIVVSATDTKKDKLAQIDSWINIINERTKGEAAIIILENKMDLDNKLPLTPNDLEQLKGGYTSYKAVSAKEEINLTELLQDVLQPAVQAERFKKNNNMKIIPVSKEAKQLNPTNRLTYDFTKLNINRLTNEQAYKILHSLLNILIHGSLNKKDKAYDITFMRGKLLTLEDNSQITVPEHVFSWISKIKSTPSFNNKSKNLLAELYDEIDQASVTKPFFRSKSTQDFYNHSLIGYIELAVKKDFIDPNLDYVSIMSTIDSLNEDKIISILNELIVTLENGSSLKNNDKPYNVGFWGGRTHTTSSNQQIKVPEHIGALLEYLTTSTDKPKAKLVRALDSILIAAYSTNSNRVESTQNFYVKLPRDLMYRINQIHIQPESEIRPPRRDG